MTGGFDILLEQCYEVWSMIGTFYRVTPVLNGHSKIDKTKLFMTNGSLTKVASIAECPLGALCNTCDLY